MKHKMTRCIGGSPIVSAQVHIAHSLSQMIHYCAFIINVFWQSSDEFIYYFIKLFRVF